MDGSPGDTAPNRDSILTFREITEHNWRAVANLTPKDGQIGNLDPNVWSLCEAHYDEDAWVRAIYAGETPIGMILMAKWDAGQKYYLWRFMIDGRYQGLGYGRRGVEFAIAHIRQHNPQAKLLRLNSTPPEGKKSENPIKNVKPEDSPFTFYQKLGFRQIAPLDEDGETPMAIDL
ncbi:GCN5 N-acetyltransferase [Polyplosphaeria fusca]|uniref:GCN5 N-acetyltransferase n=1 Tax=Polyplosphaeria fusca TaxID=682080 RepID=A0A9P4QRB4_9PLEO|nr:GCN5 N-acetyltransferase [Polyplosphaeria fusca]